ncbi:MAG: transcriptional repressor [bacterium]
MNKDVCETLAKKGHRRTQVRHLLHEILERNKYPISVPELLEKFKQKKTLINKTTIYREIEFYIGQSLVTQVRFSDDLKRYELTKNHHHHFVCQKCKTIIDLRLKNGFKKEMERLSNKYKFIINQHSLEFFGLCAKCD